MAGIWVEVWNKARTTRYGEIATASAPSFGMVLDASAEWSFTMPVGDPNAALLINERLVEAYTESAAGPRIIGTGIIKNIELSEDGESLNVSGSDLLSLLAGYSVGTLTVQARNWTYLNNSRGAARRMRRNGGGTSETNLDLTNAYDGNTGTSVAVEMRPIVSDVNYCFLYVCCDQKFSQIRVTMGATKNTVTNTVVGQYFNGTAMTGVTITSDGTLSGGKTFAQTGIIAITEPTDWQRITTSDGGNWYIVRLCVSTTDTNSFDLAEIECYADGPTTNGLSQIIACIPAGEPAWSVVNPVTAWSTTLNAAYLTFDGESILTAFESLAKATGEHFRLPTPGELTGASARCICWQRATWATISGHAELVPDSVAAPAAGGLIPILDISARGDTVELVTRVYPRGAGAGAARATLASATKVLHTTVDADSASGQKVLNVAVTSGFAAGGTIHINHGGARAETGVIDTIQTGVSLTLTVNLTNTHTALQADEVWTDDYHTGYRIDKTNNCLYNSTAETAYGRIESPQTFDNIAAIAEDAQHMSDQLAADQLCDAALAWLKTHDSIARFYSLTIAYQGWGVYPIDRLHVVAERYYQAYKAININTYPSSPLYVTGVTERIEDSGADVLDLEISTVERAAQSDESVLTNTIQQVRNVQQAGISGIQTIRTVATGNASLTGGTINGVTIGSANPAAGRFSSLSSASALDVTHPAFGARGDGSTDDQPAIQAAIDAANAAGGGIVYLPLGTYIIGATLNIKSGVMLTGIQDKSVLKLADSGNVNMITANGQDNWGIENLVLDGNKANNSGDRSGIWILDADTFRIRNCFVHDVCNCGIAGTSGLLNGWVENNKLQDCGEASGSSQKGIFFYSDATGGIERLRITGNIVSGSGTDGILIYRSTADQVVRDVILDGNICYSNGAITAGMGIYVSGFSGANPATYIIMSNNRAWAQRDQLEMSYCKYSNMVGNVVSDSVTQDGVEGDGLVLQYCSYCQVTGNVAFNNRAAGITLQTSTYCNVVGNQCFYNNRSDGAGLAGIDLYETSTNNLIEGNVSTDSGTAKQIGIAERGATPDYNYVYNNYVANNLVGTAQISLSGANSKAKYNIGHYTEKEGATNVADGGTVTHGLSVTPTWATGTPSVSGEFVSVTALAATTFTVAIKKHDNSAGTTQTIYWRAGA
jgi:parallel beta-helix repeat protein